MKRLMSLVVVLMLGVALCAFAADSAKKCPAGTVACAAKDTTKKVGTAACNTVGAVTETAAKATKNVAETCGDVVEAVSDTTEKAAESCTK